MALMQARSSLGEVVVGPGVEALHAVVEARARRQHQYRRPHALRAQPPRDLIAVHAGQHHVENDEVVDAREGEFQPQRTVIRRLGGKAVLGEELAERPAEELFVFYHQYVHMIHQADHTPQS